MTPRQIDLIRTSWSAVETMSDATATMFYERLFELDPALRRLFARTDMEAQRRILMQTFKVMVASLDEIDTIVPFIQVLGRVHARYGVREDHYQTVGAALLWTLGKVLGDAFDDETAHTWATAYTTLASVMIEAAEGEETAAAAVA